MQLSPTVSYPFSVFSVMRRDSAKMTLFLKSDPAALAEATELLENKQSNPFMTHRDKSRYMRNLDFGMRLTPSLDRINEKFESPLTTEELFSLYILVEHYTTTCG